MQLNKFIKSTKLSNSPRQLSGIYFGLWYVINDKWDLAHTIIQEINTIMASQLHAYLYRMKGDISNAKYWYNKAGYPLNNQSLQSELDDIIRVVLK